MYVKELKKIKNLIKIMQIKRLTTKQKINFDTTSLIKF